MTRHHDLGGRPAGPVERVGRTLGYVGTAGQTLDLIVQMKALGTVSGRVMERFNGVEFREWENVGNVSSSAISWMSWYASYAHGTRPNY